jgi:hypothetical protein
MQALFWKNGTPVERFNKPIVSINRSFSASHSGAPPKVASPESMTLGRGYGFRAHRIRSQVYARSALYDAHIGNSPCAVALQNDAACDSNFEIA